MSDSHNCNKICESRNHSVSEIRQCKNKKCNHKLNISIDSESDNEKCTLHKVKSVAVFSLIKTVILRVFFVLLFFPQNF